MIKALIKLKNGKQLILLGLSEENIKRLKQDEPIIIKGKDLGFNGYDIWIIAGDTEESITEDLKGIFGDFYVEKK